MKQSNPVLTVGAALFVLPVPGTFVTGALVLVAGLVARWFGR
ncbi:hypothetical protein [Halocalculus aciditolerans]|nr:hypothetical protein [Halocalculus aciditolerans]